MQSMRHKLFESTDMPTYSLATNKYCLEYIDETNDLMYEAFVSAVTEERENAFNVGFDTAIKLIIGGNCTIFNGNDTK